ncbi:hypothetical protein THMIRHAT_22810 [Thiosulfativibrio zosterae]|uniref:Uncharacterized protein n=1 Tax=Thiosulfativibrio zosterae TaxID=2675053 RepID=A0A6F8PQZ6_9GAMM|nr:hypothetical protein THMIRHAT_22810 [Thiosulfativibrio zosterae]
MVNSTGLKRLDLQRCTQLNTLPESLGALQQLELLRLDGTALETLPQSLGDLTNLRLLSLEGTQLRQLPESIKNLHNLRRLNLLKCKVTELPPELAQNQQLKINSKRVTTPLPNIVNEPLHTFFEITLTEVKEVPLY